MRMEPASYELLELDTHIDIFTRGEGNISMTRWKEKKKKKYV